MMKTIFSRNIKIKIPPYHFISSKMSSLHLKNKIYVHVLCLVHPPSKIKIPIPSFLQRFLETKEKFLFTCSLMILTKVKLCPHYFVLLLHIHLINPTVFLIISIRINIPKLPQVFLSMNLLLLELLMSLLVQRYVPNMRPCACFSL